ncbi:uncharacterized protein [Triticum aestivum]|uniref:uncharacterized protein n=1 Tax=Triticum aestivum TaxID=4565 RepID=UPI001D00A8F8|nr:uncharacterized protein LOC123132177 [Triticum aestivum]
MVVAVASEGAGEARCSRRSRSLERRSCSARRTPGATSPSSPPPGRLCGWPMPRSPAPTRCCSPCAPSPADNKVCIFYSAGWILVMKVVPGFLLYRGLHELGQYAFLEILWEPAIKKEFLLYPVAFLVRICYCHQKVYYLTMQNTRCHDDLMSLTTSSLPVPISSALVAAGSWTTSSRRLLQRPTCEGQIIFQ